MIDRKNECMNHMPTRDVLAMIVQTQHLADVASDSERERVKSIFYFHNQGCTVDHGTSWLLVT